MVLACVPQIMFPMHTLTVPLVSDKRLVQRRTHFTARTSVASKLTQAGEAPISCPSGRELMLAPPLNNTSGPILNAHSASTYLDLVVLPANFFLTGLLLASLAPLEP